MNLKVVGLLLAGLLTGILVGLLFLLTLRKEARTPLSTLPERPPAKGMPLAGFELSDLNGESVQLSQLKGHPTVVNFWATWCTPCKVEMPLLQAAYEAHQPNLAVIGVNVQEPGAMVKAFVEENQLTFPILLDEKSEVFTQYRLRGLPTTYFLDADGVLRNQHVGQLNQNQLDGYLKEIGVEP